MVTPSGAIKEFGPPATEPNMAPAEITVGPDGNLWFLDAATPAIGRITPAGVITEFTSGLLPGAMPETLTAGADGNMWFTDKAQGAIGRVTPAGVIKEFSTGKAGSMPTESTLGADGNVWFSDPGVPAVGRVTPDGTITEFKTGLNANADPDPMTLGPDGNVWFIDQNAADRAVGRITPSGAITEFDQGPQPEQSTGRHHGRDRRQHLGRAGLAGRARGRRGGENYDRRCDHRVHERPEHQPGSGLGR